MITLAANSTELVLDPGYALLKDYIIASTGLAYYCDKDDDLGRRIGNRLTACELPDCTAYYQRLNHPQSGDGELDNLVEELTVGETSFFRHAELFEGLRRTVLPDLLSRNQEQRRLRIWSAGCSIGAEAYSVAIMLAREFGVQTAGWEISILGTDINRKFLNRAHEGVFHAWDFRGAQQQGIEDCFTRRGDTWTIKAEYRRWVNFQYHNLVRHPFPSLVNNLVAFDVVLCRNVLIYFRPEISQEIIDKFHPCLVEGGWLLVGHAEPNIRLFREYRTVNVPGAVLYQKASVEPVVRREVAVVSVPVVQATTKRRMTGRVMPAIRLSEGDGGQWLRIQSLADHGELAGALNLCKGLVKAEPMNATLHLYLAMLAEQMGEGKQAEGALRSALYLKPESALAYYYGGLIQQKRGGGAEASRSFEKVLKYLGERNDEEAICEADGMTVGDLRELTRMQQEMLRP